MTYTSEESKMTLLGSEAVKMIDKEALLVTTEGLEVPVKIVNVRGVYGRTDYQVTPLGGNGTVWVSSSRVKAKA